MSSVQPLTRFLGKTTTWVRQNAVLKVQEKYFISKPVFSRLKDSRDFNQIKLLLSETGFGIRHPDLNEFNWEEALESEIKWSFSFLEELGFSFVVRPFRVLWDLKNICSLVRSKVLGKEPVLYDGLGNIELDVLLSAYKEDAWHLVEEYAEHVEHALKSLMRGAGHFYIENYFDRIYLENLLEKTAQLSFIFDECVRAMIDCRNVLLVVRASALNQSVPVELFAHGGKIPPEDILKYWGDVDGLWARFVNNRFYGHLFASASSPDELTWNFYDYVSDIAELGKFAIFGLEPAASFILRKLSEVERLRKIFVG